MNFRPTRNIAMEEHQERRGRGGGQRGHFGNFPLLSEKLTLINSYISYGSSIGSEIQPKAPLLRSRTKAFTEKVGFGEIARSFVRKSNDFSQKLFLQLKSGFSGKILDFLFEKEGTKRKKFQRLNFGPNVFHC